jgi:osmotically-inducible protein OsmY
MKKSDSEIKEAVTKELKWDTRVDEAAIGVAVTGGVVTLTGAVNSWGKKISAQEAAHRVAGVLDVANDIAVKPTGSHVRTDTDIALAVRSVLEWDVFIPDDRIRSTVAGGWVTLEGEVDYWTSSADADRAVRNLAGVLGVTNRIEVKQARVNAADLRSALEDALKRHAERDAHRITIDIKDGRVSLTGAVHSSSERLAVMGAAKATPGVREVIDHLRVEPHAA